MVKIIQMMLIAQVFVYDLRVFGPNLQYINNSDIFQYLCVNDLKKKKLF